MDDRRLITTPPIASSRGTLLGQHSLPSMVLLLSFFGIATLADAVQDPRNDHLYTRVAPDDTRVAPEGGAPDGPASGGADKDSQALDPGRARYDAGDYGGAERFFRQRWTGADDQVCAFELGRTLMATGRWRAAVSVLEEALPAAEDDAAYHRLLGEALGRSARSASIFRQLGIARRGLHQFERAVALDPGNLEARDSLMEYYLQAPGIAGGGEAKALEQARETAAFNAAEGQRMLGRINHEKGREAAARTAYARAVQIDPGNLLARVGQARLAIDLEDWDLAFTALDAALARAPENSMARFELGRAAASSGLRLDDGAKALEAYVARPRPATEKPASEAWTLRASIAELAHDPQAARRAYRAALAADPGNKAAKRALTRLGED